MTTSDVIKPNLDKEITANYIRDVARNTHTKVYSRKDCSAKSCFLIYIEAH